MERSWWLLRVLFAGVEPIIIGLVTNQQWLVLVWLCNVCIIVLLRAVQPTQTKSPLSSHVFSYKSQVQQLQTNNNYFWALGFLALISWIVAYFLQQGNQFDKIALWLIVAGGLYRLLASVIHWVKATWHSWLSKIFGALIVVGAGWSILWSTLWQDFLTALPGKVTKLFTVPTAVAPSEMTDVTTWNVLTWNTWASVTGTSTTWTTAPAKIDTPSPQENSTKDSTKTLSYAQVVPAIIKAFAVPWWADVSFVTISKTNWLYPAFKAWYNARMFGAAINPSTLASCNVYFVMLGLAGKWNVPHTAANVFSAYAAEAVKRGKTYGCKAGGYVTEANLP